MTLEQWAAIATIAMPPVTLIGALLLAWQLRDSNRQQKLESQIHLYDINRELISLGFSNPELFDILEDAEGVDPILERRYLQLWVNQFSLMASYSQQGALDEEVEQSFGADFRFLVGMSNFQRHWTRYAAYYPLSFQRSVGNILRTSGLSTSRDDTAKG